MIKIDKQKIFILVLSILFMTSCFDEKKIAYFQQGEHKTDTISVSDAYVPNIQPGDILSIYVNSLSPQASSFFNPFTPSASTSVSAAAGSSDASTSSPALNQSASAGFLVSPAGYIEFPLLGALKISGMTTIAVQDTIKKLLLNFLKEPTVLVRFSNYKISILGEVAKPSIYVIPNERITLPEALSLAGDLTIFARRDNVQIIRDVNGKKVFATVNLNNRALFNSSYYYLHANDVVYVQPGKSKAASTDRTYILLPSIVSLISAVIILIKR